jgi:hypothetical protein
MKIDLECMLSAGFPPVVVTKADTVRFVQGSACCTSAYNYRMTDLERAALALRIAAALNATAHLNLREIQDLAPQP